MKLFGGIEAGGTKFVCSVGSGPYDLSDEIRFPTTTPEETFGRAIAYFQDQNAKQKLTSIGVAAFGPLDLDIKSATFGYITSTPKPGWAFTNVLGILSDELNIPIGIDTDVNCAALGEYEWGAAQGLETFIYLTIGTGIGGGIVAEGNLLHGAMHPEMGHIRIPYNREKDAYKGYCPYHQDCFEGIASGSAINDRWKIPAENLPRNHPAWDLEVEYIALALANYILVVSPQIIILGGGVMSQRELFPKIRLRVLELLNGYISKLENKGTLENFIVPPELGNKSGVLGAIELARRISL